MNFHPISFSLMDCISMTKKIGFILVFCFVKSNGLKSRNK